MGRLLQRNAWLIPYLLLAPGLLWLAVFYVYPGIQMFLTSLWTGTLEKGFDLTWNWSTYGDALNQFGPQFLRRHCGAENLLFRMKFVAQGGFMVFHHHLIHAHFRRGQA